MGLIHVDLDECEKDGACVDVCPVSILLLDGEKGPVVRPGFGHLCIGCGHCVAACPHGALDNCRNPVAGQMPLQKSDVLDDRMAITFLRRRRSIRCYKADRVPRGSLLKLLDIARYAPSGHNSQGISYVVVEGRERVDGVSRHVADWMSDLVQRNDPMAKALHMAAIVKGYERGEDRILRRAPAVIVAKAAAESRMAPVSTCLALEYVELYASALGLGACWAGYTQACARDYAPLVEYLAIPRGSTVTGVLMVGFPKYAYYRLPERNPLDVTWLGDGEQEDGPRE